MIKFFNRYWSVPALLSLAADTVLLSLGVFAAFILRFGLEFQGRFGRVEIGLKTAVFVLVFLIAFYLGGLYRFEGALSLRRVAIRLWRAFGAAAAALWTFYYLFPGLFMGRGLFGIALTIGFISTSLWRLLLYRLLETKIFGDRILIVGADEKARSLAREVIARAHQGYKVIGFVDDDPDLQGVSIVNPRVLGTTDRVKEVALENQATRVVVARRDFRGWINMESLLQCKTSGIPVEQAENFFERLTGMIALDGLRTSWLVFSDGFVVSLSVLFWKRVLDVVVAASMLLVASPIMLMTALLIRIDSAGPALFSQERVGRDGKIFRLRKFRSMIQDAEAHGQAVWAQRGDSRITRVGGALRRTRLDELPQLWNILVGDMSLVGPRPERPEFVGELIKLNKLYEQRLAVRPGLTGWAQINASYASSFEASIEKLQYDLFYIKNISVFLDLSIMVSTVKTVLFARGGR